MDRWTNIQMDKQKGEKWTNGKTDTWKNGHIKYQHGNRHKKY